MNELRIQTYLNLIEQLLNCPDAQGPEILQTHQELLDQGLLQVMNEVAKQLQKQGNETSATWLLNLAMQLTEGILSKSLDSRSFFVEVILCIIKNPSPREPVYRLLEANLSKLNADLVAVLPEFASELLANDDSSKTMNAIGNFGALIGGFSQGERAINLDLSVVAFEQCLQARQLPIERAVMTHNLALAYFERILGNRAENLEKAIEISQQCLLEILGNEAQYFEEDIDIANRLWLSAIQNLVNAHKDRVLIEQLSKYPDGQVQESLQAHQELICQGFLQNISDVAKQLRQQGNETRATWLLNLAFQLAEDADMGSRVSLRSEPDAVSLDSRSFFAEVILCILENPFSKEPVYRLLEANLSNLNADLVAVLPEVASELLVDDDNGKVMTAIGIFGDLINSFSQGERGINLDLSVIAFEQCLQASQLPIERAIAASNLASVYYERTLGNRAENLEKAIKISQQCLLEMLGNKAQYFEKDLATRLWFSAMQTLANAYADRVYGDPLINQDSAITFYEQCLEILTRDTMPLQWAKAKVNLATIYTERIHGDRSDQEYAITLYEQCLEVFTRDTMPAEWAQATSGLATVYSERIGGESQKANQEHAITLYTQCLEVYTFNDMPIKWAQTKYSIARIYKIRTCGDWLENHEHALMLYRECLEVFSPEQTPIRWARVMAGMAGAYKVRRSRNSAQDLEDSITAYQQALTVFRPELLPKDCRRIARDLGNLCADHQRWDDAVTSYEAALEATELLYQASLSRRSQEFELSETADLFHRAAYAQARAGNFEQALVTAEIGKARGLSEALERDRTDLAELETDAPEVFRQYRNAVDAMRQLEIEERLADSNHTEANRLSVSETNLQQARQQLKNAIDNIRQIPNYEDFTSQPSFETITAVVRPSCPLVYCLPTPNGSLVMVVHQPRIKEDANYPVTIDPIWLDDLTDWTLKALFSSEIEVIAPGVISTKGDLTENILEAFIRNPEESTTKYFSAYYKQSTWHDTLNQVTHRLWKILMNPIITHIQAIGADQAVLIPMGFLHFFPLHAAWTDDMTTPTGRRYALDVVTFTYAPNARSLKTAREIASCAGEDNLLAINDPHPTKANPLPGSDREIEAAVTHFPQHHLLKSEEANRNAVLSAIPHHDVLHFSCHGYAKVSNPLDSGLLMANDEIVSLRDFFNLQLEGMRLAILSACETGLSGTDLPDEVISLPTGLLQAGVAGIIASLWSVNDLSTMLLLGKFYELWQTENIDPPEALRHAQIWLRDNLTEAEVAPLLGQRTRNPTNRLFSHPYHWAAFSYTGV
ncbi:tetratricopeptide tpr-1 repeat-containing protein [Leptolyngbya sp. Heron Island J]|uniref:CHAT domain-containing protein n=1 Tax=Leptolyngbya sp. Heron Island J TaxID=1385935 RepID=UPI0003B99332|nr:CHAT domain-containing protein [Leptolyngbya sp. Heron Island J]ESA32438.1 tetratricopeptide tpr-1 repeat-containing protein [Leptolyngbya sp. Heron Island J]